MPEYFEQGRVGDPGGIVFDLHRLAMSTGDIVLIGRVLRASACVSGGRCGHAGHMVEILFDAPEAAAGEDRCLRFGRSNARLGQEPHGKDQRASRRWCPGALATSPYRFQEQCPNRLIAASHSILVQSHRERGPAVNGDRCGAETDGSAPCPFACCQHPTPCRNGRIVIFLRAVAAGEEQARASVVDLKFLVFCWHQRSGTSNPKPH